ncbi:MAG: histidine phosphatase family protein [Bacteroidia bacterium]
MKTLVICRHAKSDWPAGVSDIDRPLKQRGINDARYLGTLLAQQQFSPDLIVSSPANRALSTATIIGEKLGYKDEIETDRAIYDSSVKELTDLIYHLPEPADTVMIFGHNPTFEETVRYLLQMSAGFFMPTCAMACISANTNRWTNFEPRILHLNWYLIPRLTKFED